MGKIQFTCWPERHFQFPRLWNAKPSSSRPRQATGLPYSEITWPSANPAPRPSRCTPPLTALPHQRSLDLPSECPLPCPAHPGGRHPLRRVKSTMVWRPRANHREARRRGGRAWLEADTRLRGRSRKCNPSTLSHLPVNVHPSSVASDAAFLSGLGGTASEDGPKPEPLKQYCVSQLLAVFIQQGLKVTPMTVGRLVTRWKKKKKNPRKAEGCVSLLAC